MIANMMSTTTYSQGVRQLSMQSLVLLPEEKDGLPVLGHGGLGALVVRGSFSLWRTLSLLHSIHRVLLILLTLTWLHGSQLISTTSIDSMYMNVMQCNVLCL